LFLDQLIRTLQIEQTTEPAGSLKISGPSGGGATLSEMGATAARHGKELLYLGFTVDQVVHDYGDLCQAVTDLAFERDAPFQVDEFRTLNRCLDNAIADAVTEFSYQRDFVAAERQAYDTNERLGFFAHELRNFFGTVTLAFTAAKTGNLNLSGATGAVLERNLVGMRNLIDSSLTEVRMVAGNTVQLQIFSLADFIDSNAPPGATRLNSKFPWTLKERTRAVDGAGLGRPVQPCRPFAPERCMDSVDLSASLCP
jgi:hypothetical protein